MRRLLVASLMGVLLTASTTFAADQKGGLAISPAVTAAVAALAPRLDVVAANAQISPRSFRYGRPTLLPALYGTSAFLQGYDAYSTLTVLQHGGVEANPVMKGITKNPAAFIGLKASVTMMSIIAAERMWKRNNRFGAVMTMVVSNSLMAMVAANNARVLSQVRRK